MRVATILIVLVVLLAVVLAVALIWSTLKRKQDQVGRQRASELRSEAATTAADQHEQEARAREAEAEADRVRAQADKLEVRAQEQRTSYDMTRAQQEDSLREADRVDPDVDHRASHYQPDLNGSPAHRADTRIDPQNDTGIDPPNGRQNDPHNAQQNGHAEDTWSPRESTGPANPVPTGPETIVPEDEQDRGDHI